MRLVGRGCGWTGVCMNAVLRIGANATTVAVLRLARQADALGRSMNNSRQRKRLQCVHPSSPSHRNVYDAPPGRRRNHRHRHRWSVHGLRNRGRSFIVRPSAKCGRERLGWGRCCRAAIATRIRRPKSCGTAESESATWKNSPKPVRGESPGDRSPTFATCCVSTSRRAGSPNIFRESPRCCRTCGSRGSASRS